MTDVAAHDQVETFREDVVYPAHAQRTESPEFGRNKRLLVKQLDLPCWVCGSREKREVHHLFEWAWANDLDWDKVLDTLHVFDPYGFTHKMGEQPITTCDDARNLLVLCGECEIDGVSVPGGHHRGVDAGVHHLTFPTWLAQRAVKAGVATTKALAAPQGAHGALQAAAPVGDPVVEPLVADPLPSSDLSKG